jgi:DNA-binding GntR family transcriptional regulator
MRGAMAVSVSSVMTAGSSNRRVGILPPSQDAAFVFEALDMGVAHVVGRLADPSTALTTSQRKRIERHIQAQSAAAGGHASRFLGADFLRLLAACGGNAAITELIDALLACQRSVPPACPGLQRQLLDAVLGHRPDEAMAIFRQGRRDFEQSLR